MRIKIIQQSKELQENQQLLIQEYNQLSIENQELKQMYYKQKLSFKKSETTQNQQIILRMISILVVIKITRQIL
ncbi:unnamed protein product [Paramecium pentaurelia]|uniref:Uncharacterized protein n=1 Tax=Paramecium pentaurelia TaxID=43138 RepID=A0A8S1XPS9_9CILI|nr:unnamed protein product [Paramecium pentaurelia]